MLSMRGLAANPSDLIKHTGPTSVLGFVSSSAMAEGTGKGAGTRRATALQQEHHQAAGLHDYEELGPTKGTGMPVKQ